jgi:hypothetical protein
LCFLVATKKPTKKKVTPNSQKISPHFIDLFTKSLDTFFDEEGGDLAEELTDYIQHDLMTSLKESLKSAMLGVSMSPSATASSSCTRRGRRLS